MPYGFNERYVRGLRIIVSLSIFRWVFTDCHTHTGVHRVDSVTVTLLASRSVWPMFYCTHANTLDLVPPLFYWWRDQNMLLLVQLQKPLTLCHVYDTADGRYSLLGQPLQYSLCPPTIMHSHSQSSYSSHQVSMQVCARLVFPHEHVFCLVKLSTLLNTTSLSALNLCASVHRAQEC